MSTGLWIGILASSGIPEGGFESIETVTLANSTTASVTFSSISGYQHLQIRGIAKNTRLSPYDASTFIMRFNGDSGSNYFTHRLRGDGSTVSSTAYTTRDSIYMVDYASNNTANVFTGFVIDILDYSSTTKSKTVRSFQGADFNGAGYSNIMSGAWNNTNAVTSITLADGGGYYFTQHSTFALYGIKAP